MRRPPPAALPAVSGHESLAIPAGPGLIPGPAFLTAEILLGLASGLPCSLAAFPRLPRISAVANRTPERNGCRRPGRAADPGRRGHFWWMISAT